jgi:hypothetical protein
VELVDWDDDDAAFEAASPTAFDSPGEATLAGLGAGCIAAPSEASLTYPAPTSGGSSTATPAETSTAPSHAPVLVHGHAEASARLKSIVVRPAAPSPAGKLGWQGVEQEMGVPSV